MTAALPCTSTDRMIADAETSAMDGHLEWAPAKSLWITGMVGAALLLGPIFVTPGAVALFAATTIATLCAGHSVGMHRLLVHRSFSAKPWVEYLLIYLGTLVGMAGPVGMIRLHDMRDWAQRQAACHDLHANRLPMLRDALLQMHARLVLKHPPRFRLEPRVAEDRVLRWLEATWMLQQLPWAVLFYAIGGWPWVIWGIPVRIAVSLTGHWLVVHLTHRNGPQGWVVDASRSRGTTCRPRPGSPSARPGIQPTMPGRTPRASERSRGRPMRAGGSCGGWSAWASSGTSGNRPT